MGKTKGGKNHQPMNSPERTRPSMAVTLKGIIVPANLNEDFDATSLMILTDNEEDYLIAPNSMGTKLYEHLKKAVRVTGTVKKDSSGNNVIKVSDYESLEQ